MLKKIIGAFVAMTISALGFAAPSFADESQGGGETIVLNPGGGRAADGSDGIAIVFNGVEGAIGVDSADVDYGYVPATGSDQVYFASSAQWCCGGAGPVLNIGGTAYGESGAANDNDATSWDSIDVTASTGAKKIIANGSTDSIESETAKGNATATILYSIVHNSRTYTVSRAISYTYPNTYYDETWTVTIPSGNTDTVKFYLGGDAAPGSSDVGVGEYKVIDGKINLREKNPDSGQYISYIERGTGSAFTHYFIGNYDTPYDGITAGSDLDDSVDTNTESTHDAGLQIQWTFGSTAGTYAKTMRTKIGFIADMDKAEELPNTGFDASGLALAGFALAGLGAVAVIRRRARA